MKKNHLKILTLLFLSLSFSVQSATVLNSSWKDVIRGRCSDQGSSWWSSSEAIRIAENVLLYQKDIGGWPKNTNMQNVLTEVEKNNLKNAQSNNAGCTIDNGAVSYELTYLSKVYNAVSDATLKAKLKASFLKGIDYLIKMQYDNGGWPQFYPLKGGYADHITYNDNAMVNVLQILRHVYNKDNTYSIKADADVVAAAKAAFDKGIECILNTQYRQKGKLTVWCAQHHYKTLAPALARSYELPSLSGSESAGIIKLLISLNNPSDEIIRAVYCSANWFDETRIVGQRLIDYTNSDGLADKKIIFDSSAPDMWARFYTLENNTPFFCDRDGIKKYSIAEIGHERRNGYSWYGSAGFEVISKYNSWLKSNGKTIIAAPLPNAKQLITESIPVRAFANKYTGKSFQKLELIVDTNTVYTYTETDIDTVLTDFSAGAHSIMLRAVYAGDYTETDTTLFTVEQPSFKLTIFGGEGGGTYPLGSAVTIEADPPRTGREFKKWLGDVDNVEDIYSAKTKIIIPAGDATLRATYQMATSVEENLINLICYPNPASDILTVDLTETGNSAVEIFDIEGKVIYAKNNLTGKITIPVSSFASGQYILRITGEEGNHSTKLIIE